MNTLFYIPGEVGGSETYLLEILRHWKSTMKDHSMVLFTQRENHQKLEDEFAGEGWSCVFCDFAASNRVTRILREQLELPRKVKRAGVEVLWSPGYTSPFFSACPQVLSILDMQYKSFPHDLSRVARWTTELLVQMGCRRAKHLLTISEFSKSEILKYTSTDASKISVTLLAANPGFAPQGEMKREPILLCVANSYPHKNVDQLIRAFALIEAQIPHALVLIGKPRLGEPALEAAMAKIQDPTRVIRKQGLSRQELVAAYQQADLFVFPSLYEGFGLPVLEALIAGTPVVTTRCGSLPEVGGAWVHYYDERSDEDLAKVILAVLASRESWGGNPEVAAWIEGFSWASTAEKTMKVLVEQGEGALSK
ncbi:glycosyltransferase family 1 protein [Kiritimatiellota bacterium B12222]|nr:glycosyltransferase family 1 protein [Kiritimatiellota bacterium B12222]